MRTIAPAQAAGAIREISGCLAITANVQGAACQSSVTHAAIHDLTFDRGRCPSIVARMKPSSILLAIPDYGGTIKTPCFKSVIDTFQLLSRLGIKAGLLTYDLSDIAVSRNIMSSIFLQQPNHSHLLFVDSDMEFRPETLAKMVGVEKLLIGCAYPRRDIDISKLVELGKDRPISSPFPSCYELRSQHR